MFTSVIPSDSPFGLLKQALDGLAFRQNLLSNNIANASTPGYVARDVDFKKTLQSLRHADAEPLALSTNGLPEGSGLAAGDTEGASSAWQGAVTRSTTPDMRAQMVAVSENGLHFAAVTQAVNQQLSRYRMVIREGK